MSQLGRSALREESEANALSGSDEHVIQGKGGILCCFIWFIPLDVFCSAAAAVSLQEMKVFTEPGPPFAQLQDALLRQARPLIRTVMVQTSLRLTWVNLYSTKKKFSLQI